jgi:hypothetical protein
MLTLLPIEYWMLLFIASIMRLAAFQIINKRIYYLLNSGASYSLKEFRCTRLFMLIGGIGNAIIIFGLMSIFYMTFNYIVPINEYSAYYLECVKFISWILVGVSLILISVSLGVMLKIE